MKNHIFRTSLILICFLTIEMMKQDDDIQVYCEAGKV